MKKSISPWLDTVPDTRRFPLLNRNETADVVVVGGGIAGVLAAYQLAAAGQKVILLEKNHLATGDTGLTTGFLSRVPDTSVAESVQKYGEEAMRSWFRATAETQNWLIDLILRQQIDCDLVRSHSYYSAYTANDPTLDGEWAAVAKMATHARRVTKQDLPELNVPFAEAIEFADEAAFHSRKFLFGLLGNAVNLPLRVFEESEVIGVTPGPEIVVTLKGGIVKAKKLVLATGAPISAFSELRPLVEGRLTFVIGAHYEEAPISSQLFWDTADPYYYYRLVDPHTLIVGGCDRPVAKKDETLPAATLEQFLQEHFVGKAEVTHAWSGSIFHTADGLPYGFAHPHYNNVFVAMGFGGNGLIGGALASRVVTNLVLGRTDAAISLLSFERTKTVIAKPAVKLISGPTKKAFVIVAKVGDLKPGQPICVKAGEEQLFLMQIGDKYFALNNTCSHAGGSLCDGIIDKNIITCPLHAARFDITTGQVVGPPAIRPQDVYRVRVSGENIEVEINTSPDEAKPAGPRPKKRTHWRQFFVFSIGAFVFWVAEFFYQYLHLIPGEVAGSLVRSFALSGATLLGLALFLSALFKWVPRWAIHWRLRRYLGVSGFVFIFLHVLSVTKYLFQWQIKNFFFSFNPLDNPIIFGLIAFPIFFAMAATSTDWAVAKLGGRRWKQLHRLVYIGYLAAIFHFLFIGPTLLANPAGYLLLALTFLAVFGQLYWYIHTVMRRKFRTWGALYGGILIVLSLAIGYFGFIKYYRPLMTPSAVTLAISESEESLEISVERMKEFMKENIVDPETATQPIVWTQQFEHRKGAPRGAFRNLNYMTSGHARIETRGSGVVLIFEADFQTPPGPDLVVYLTNNTEPTTRLDITNGFLVGKLKSTVGEQIYELPDMFEMPDFKSISIHCRAFNVPWSYAILE